MRYVCVHTGIPYTHECRGAARELCVVSLVVFTTTYRGVHLDLYYRRKLQVPGT